MGMMGAIPPARAIQLDPGALASERAPSDPSAVPLPRASRPHLAQSPRTQDTQSPCAPRSASPSSMPVPSCPARNTDGSHRVLSPWLCSEPSLPALLPHPRPSFLTALPEGTPPPLRGFSRPLSRLLSCHLVRVSSVPGLCRRKGLLLSGHQRSPGPCRAPAPRVR